MKNRVILQATLFTSLLLFAAPSAFCQGSLTPPGAPAATMKTLAQVEPRTPISSLPFIINTGGSYYLTQNLTASSGVNGIIIQADNVTIDLNGFTLSGNSVGLVGINSTALTPKRSVVKNGTLVDWQTHGIALGSDSRVEDVEVFSENGIAVGDGSKVLRCRSVLQGLTAAFLPIAITVGNRSTVDHCMVETNAATYSGIYTGSNVTIQSCSIVSLDSLLTHAIQCEGTANITDVSIQGAAQGIRGNDITQYYTISKVTARDVASGIEVDGGASISNCTLKHSNASNAVAGEVGIKAYSANISSVTCTGYYIGISVEASSTILDSFASGNIQQGIKVGINCTVRGNTCISNGSTGIFCTGGINRIEGNSIEAYTPASWIFLNVASGQIVQKNSFVGHVDFGAPPTTSLPPVAQHQPMALRLLSIPPPAPIQTPI